MACVCLCHSFFAADPAQSRERIDLIDIQIRLPSFNDLRGEAANPDISSTAPTMRGHEYHKDIQRLCRIKGRKRLAVAIHRMGYALGSLDDHRRAERGRSSRHAWGKCEQCLDCETSTVAPAFYTE